jgi:hypothetical protein
MAENFHRRSGKKVSSLGDNDKNTFLHLQKKKFIIIYVANKLVRPILVFALPAEFSSDQICHCCVESRHESSQTFSQVEHNNLDFEPQTCPFF